VAKRDVHVDVAKSGDRYHLRCGSLCEFIYTFAADPDGKPVERVETFCPKCRRNLMEGEFQIL